MRREGRSFRLGWLGIGGALRGKGRCGEKDLAGEGTQLLAFAATFCPGKGGQGAMLLRGEGGVYIDDGFHARVIYHL